MTNHDPHTAGWRLEPFLEPGAGEPANALAHGGDVTIEASPGGGIRMLITLPFVAISARAAAQSPETEAR